MSCKCVQLQGRDPLVEVGTRVEDLAELGWFAEVDDGGYLQEIVSGGV